MRRLVVAGAALAGVALCARRASRACGSFDVTKMVERMPENAPPRWLVRNVAAIRENTERILVLLEGDRRPSEARDAATVA